MGIVVQMTIGGGRFRTAGIPKLAAALTGTSLRLEFQRTVSPEMQASFYFSPLLLEKKQSNNNNNNKPLTFSGF